MIKGFKQIVSLTMVSRVLGMLRDVCFSYYFGATALSDAWLIAFRIPNLTRRVFGEGAAAASFIPVYTEQLEKDPESAARLANTVITAIFLLLSSVVVCGWIFMGSYSLLVHHTTESSLIMILSSIMLPYAVMICIVAVISGMLNVHQHFAAPAAAPVILNTVLIATLVTAGFFLNVPIGEVAVSVIFIGIAQIALVLWPLRKLGLSVGYAWDVNSEAFRKIIILMGPMILGLTVTQINTLADDMIAWFFSGSMEKGNNFVFMGKTFAYPLWRGSVSHLYYSQRLYQLPLGVFGISLATAIFPVLSRAAAAGDMEKLRKTISDGMKCAVFIAIPATAGLILVAKPVIGLLFEHGERFLADDTANTAFTLICYSIGLSGFFMQQIITRAFYSLQDSKMPAKSALIAVAVNLCLNLTLIWFIGTGGLALSTALCSYLQVLILFCVLRKRFGETILDGFFPSLFKILAAAAVMFAVCFSVNHILNMIPAVFWKAPVFLVINIILAASVYYICARLFRIEALRLLFRSSSREK